MQNELIWNFFSLSVSKEIVLFRFNNLFCKEQKIFKRKKIISIMSLSKYGYCWLLQLHFVHNWFWSHNLQIVLSKFLDFSAICLLCQCKYKICTHNHLKKHKKNHELIIEENLQKVGPDAGVYQRSIFKIRPNILIGLQKLRLRPKDRSRLFIYWNFF